MCSIHGGFNKRFLNRGDKALLKTVIEPNGRNLQYWKDLWRYRGLALNLARRDITVRTNRPSRIGWSVIGPFINMPIIFHLRHRGEIMSDDARPR